MIIILAESAWSADAGDVLATHLDQARFFIKKMWYDDAARELEAAAATPDGRVNFEVWYLLSTVDFQLCDLDGAIKAASRAHSYARDDAQLESAVSFETYLAEEFGTVEVRGSYDGLTGRVPMSPVTPILDPDAKDYANRLPEYYDERVLLPIRVGLPIGTWKIGDQTVTVTPGAITTATLTPRELGSGTAELARVEVSFGGSAWLGKDVRNTWPGPSMQLSVSQPVGPLVVGGLVDWSARWFGTVNDGIGASPLDVSAGARVGVDLGEPDDGIVVRPSLGARYGYIPGISRACLAIDTDRFECAKEPPADVFIYGNGRVVAPFVELSVDAWSRARKSALGVGVKGSVEQAFGRLPPDATAELPSGASVSYTVPGEARGFTATGVRALMNLTLAF